LVDIKKKKSIKVYQCFCNILVLLYVLTLYIGRKLKEMCCREFYFQGNATTESNCMFSRAVSIP